MSKNLFKLIFFSIVAILVVLGLIKTIIFSSQKPVAVDSNLNTNLNTPTDLNVDQVIATKLAEASCIKGGQTLEPGTYDKSSDTWSFNANLNATKTNCQSVCVVSLKDNTANIKWLCTDEQPTNTNTSIPPVTDQVIYCQPEQRKADFCIEIYEPVCATVNIQCIKAPCNPVKQTFGNSCEACKNSLVPSYTKGECAK